MPLLPLRPPASPLSWQQQLTEAFTNIDDLCHFLELNKAELPVSVDAARQFTMKVPLSFASAMAKGDPKDPLLLQVLPVTAELNDHSGYTDDPVGDINAAVMPGLIHKYHGRALLINTGSCAINCRYCFRRNFPYQEMGLGKQQEHHVMQHIRTDTSLTEIILSGGDPLLLSDARLSSLLQQIEAIDHIKRIRIHSRLPIVLPARITKPLLELLSTNKKQIVLVVHCNHANEISDEVQAAFELLRKSGIFLLNQSVLLKGINDQADILCDLSERLFVNGILPYYLHALDKAKGTRHFAVSDAESKEIIQQVRGRLPGYLVPKLVQEIAGEDAKKLLY